VVGARTARLGRWLVACACASTFTWGAAAPRAARAEESRAAPGTGAVERARSLFQEGVKLYQGGDVLGARQRFAEAEQLHHAPVIVYNLALCDERLGRVQAAVDGYERYIADEGERGEFATAAAVAAAQLKARAARLRVESEPPGMRVFIDGAQLQERTPTAVLLGAGAHHVVVEADEYREERDLTLEPRASETLRFKRPSLAMPAPRAPASRPPPAEVPAPTPPVPPKTPPAPAPDGFVFGAHFVAVPYAFFKADKGPQEASATGASIGLAVEGGYAFTRRAEILVRALTAIGSECGSVAGSNFLSMGPAISVRALDWAWLGVGLLGGQAQSCTGTTKLATNIVFSPTFDLAFSVATKPYGQWLITASIGYYFANPANDNRVLYAPIGFGLRFF
jgi:hypothetical protein